MAGPVAFDKYDAGGSYHWNECDRRLANWKRYNPALDARYALTARAVTEVDSNGSLLDVGCGDGVLMARVAPTMESVRGVDSEPTAIRWAREKLKEFPNCEVLQVDNYNLPFADAVFDIVTSTDVIEHLKEPAAHLREIRRVLKPGGHLVLTTPQWRAGGKWDLRHEMEYRPDELRSLLVQYFENVRLRFYWPAKWSRFYNTRLGWRLLKLVAIFFGNPFLGIGEDPRQFGQILATCRKG